MEETNVLKINGDDEDDELVSESTEKQHMNWKLLNIQQVLLSYEPILKWTHPSNSPTFVQPFFLSLCRIWKTWISRTAFEHAPECSTTRTRIHESADHVGSRLECIACYWRVQSWSTVRYDRVEFQENDGVFSNPEEHIKDGHSSLWPRSICLRLWWNRVVKPSSSSGSVG